MKTTLELIYLKQDLIVIQVDYLLLLQITSKVPVHEQLHFKVAKSNSKEKEVPILMLNDREEMHPWNSTAT